MYRFIRIQTIAGLVALIASPAIAGGIQQSIAAHDAIDCKPAVEYELGNYGVDRSKVTKIDYLDTSAGGYEEGAGMQSFQALISLSSCTGSLIFALDNACYVERIFSTGRCRDIGLPVK